MNFLADAFKSKGQQTGAKKDPFKPYIKAADEPVAVPETPAQPASVIKALMQSIAREYPERSHKTVHASDLTKEDFCARQFCLMDIQKVEPKPRYIDTALKVTFDVGRAIGALVCEQWLVERAVGHWYCPACGDYRHFCKRPDDTGCKGHKPTHHWIYQEVGFMDPVLKYTGSLDLLLDLGEARLHVVELKIMAPSMFDPLVAPLAEHRLRTALYLNLVSVSKEPYADQINTAYGTVLYVSRGHGKKHADHNTILPFKEYTIERDDESIAIYLKRAEQVETFRTKGLLPPRTCPHSICAKANACQVRNICFSDTYPSQQ